MSGSLPGLRVAVLGFGNQGRAHALNLRDSGCEVVVGARPGHPGEARARALGFTTLAPIEAIGQAPVVAVLLPDEVVPELWPRLAAAWKDDTALVFAHGFNLVYSELVLPPRGDVVLVSPTGPGQVLRERFEKGEGLPAYLALHQDFSGRAWALAEAYAAALGCARARLWRTTVTEETEVDLFGEQAVVVGGVCELVEAAFATLVDAGYDERIAYLEVVHQLKHLVDVIHEAGPDGLRERISGTALYGALTRGPRVINAGSRAALAELLAEVRSGAFAAEWQAEVRAGSPRLAALRAAARERGLTRARARSLPGPNR